ncbi:DEA(D/H)-box RNA helicase family protein [Actinidia rufa]|uniref:RNA helicase n=1 Tax=Actinidia rufa TaxID=165716 RepID=A0A7J0E456_9ERIC|nr:DEA(D/H)-box RNA helicase family protein [Actinidia rufa]
MHPTNSRIGFLLASGKKLLIHALLSNQRFATHRANNVSVLLGVVPNSNSYASLRRIFSKFFFSGRRAFCGYALEQFSDDNYDCDCDNHKASSSVANIDEWKWKLSLLLRSEKDQEIVSRDKRDRRDYEQISNLAKRMGLYCEIYGKVVVASKVPLPNYRPDLDDKRPQREVVIPLSLQRRVEGLLQEHFDRMLLSSEKVTGTSADTKVADRVDDVDPDDDPDSFLDGSVMEKVLQRRSLQMRNMQSAWQESPEGRKMLDFRRSLPAFKEKESLLQAIARNQVVVISGETGCGKTTQLPQYILESEIESGRGAFCSIICTQPRRISAMAVAERVSTERGEPLGESVGYKVRLEGMKGRNTHLLFCTSGILLRRLLSDRDLNGITHVFVDEIHERGMNEDFLLIVLKDLLPRRRDLRLILMSATLNAELFSNYFTGAPKIHIPGFTHPVTAHFLEDVLEMTGYKLTSFNQIDDYGQEKMWKTQRQLVPRKRKNQITALVEDAINESSFENYSSRARDSLSCWTPDCIGFNLIEAVLCHICRKERAGAVLVFMTGWEDISCLKDQLKAHPLLGDPNRVLLLTCHGSMATAEQKLIFEKPPPNVRKIVLATNMAEASITVNDIVFVVDCGKAKETTYDALNNTPCLLPSWISQASAKQRRGRAGRVQPGKCYHLYPRCVYEAFSEYQLPELLRTPLNSLCLQIKSLQVGSIGEFLSAALQPPEPLADLVDLRKGLIIYIHASSVLESFGGGGTAMTIADALSRDSDGSWMVNFVVNIGEETIPQEALGPMTMAAKWQGAPVLHYTWVRGLLLSLWRLLVVPVVRVPVVQNAIGFLKMIGALDENEHLTHLGGFLSMLPVDPKLGKMLIMGAIFRCFDPILTIVAGLSVRDPFLLPQEKKDLAGTAKSRFSAKDYSDHMALVRAYEGWKDAEREGSAYEYCWRNFLSAQTLQAIHSLRKQFSFILRDAGLVDADSGTNNGLSHNQSLVRAIICSGLFPGIASVVHRETSMSFKTMDDGQVLLYANSVNARYQTIPYPWLVFGEKVKVNTVFVRDSTGVSDSILILFGGTLSHGVLAGHLKMLEGYIDFFMDPSLAECYVKLKEELDKLLQKKKAISSIHNNKPSLTFLEKLPEFCTGAMNSLLPLSLSWLDCFSPFCAFLLDLSVSDLYNLPPLNLAEPAISFLGLSKKTGGTEKQLQDPSLDIYKAGKYLMLSVQELVSGDQCEGRFVFGRESRKPKESSDSDRFTRDGANPKSLLQTLLMRAGHSPPKYKTKHLKTNEFRALVELKGMQFVGKPKKNKQLAERDAAAIEALAWLTQTSDKSQGRDDNSAPDVTDNMLKLLVLMYKAEGTVHNYKGLMKALGLKYYFGQCSYSHDPLAAASPKNSE